MLALLSVVLALVASAPSAPVQDDNVRDLSRTIAREKDAVDPKVFERLAGLGGKSSFAALEKSLGLLKDPATRAAAYAAFRHYREDEKLAPKALELLAEETREARELAWREDALRALLHFEDAALELLEDFAEDHDDPSCRTIATDVLLVRLADRGDAAGLVTILANTSLAQDKGIPYLGVDETRRAEFADRTHRSVVRELLRGRLELETLPIFAERLAARDVGRVRKLLVLRLVAELSDEEASEVLADTCRDRDPAVALLAIDLLAPRPAYAGREQALRPLLGSKEPSLRRAAVLALGVVLADDERFASEVLELARSGDAATRMGAAGALVEVRTPDALEALHGLVVDPEWSVRVEALQRVGLWRDKASIPLLIERLSAESGRLVHDARAALVDVTRIDLGRLPGAWTRWWENEGPHFVVPDAEAREVETRWTEPKAGASTAEDFYTIRVLSERVAFVLDISGSMRLRSETSLGTVERSRMDVAKEQLSGVLRQLPDGTLFNVIFFESNLRPLEKRLVVMKKSTRAKALRFVRDQYAVGATALYPALELAFEDPLLDTVFLLSDGAPTVGELTDIEEIRAEVARWNSARHVKIHGVAMGQDSTLLRWLAEDTGGKYTRTD